MNLIHVSKPGWCLRYCVHRSNEYTEASTSFIHLFAQNSRRAPPATYLISTRGVSVKTVLHSRLRKCWTWAPLSIAVGASFCVATLSCQAMTKFIKVVHAEWKTRCNKNTLHASTANPDTHRAHWVEHPNPAAQKNDGNKSWPTAQIMATGFVLQIQQKTRPLLSLNQSRFNDQLLLNQINYWTHKNKHARGYALFTSSQTRHV